MYQVLFFHVFFSTFHVFTTNLSINDCCDSFLAVYLGLLWLFFVARGLSLPCVVVPKKNVWCVHIILINAQELSQQQKRQPPPPPNDCARFPCSHGSLKYVCLFFFINDCLNVASGLESLAVLLTATAQAREKIHLTDSGGAMQRL